MTWVAGADGCPDGWIVVLADASGREPPAWTFSPAFADIPALAPSPAVIAVDMPIGLPEKATGRGRTCHPPDPPRDGYGLPMAIYA